MVKSLYNVIFTRKHHSQESREVNPYPAGDYTAVRNIQTVYTGIAKANVK